jgi:hypothetical protein
VGLRSLGLSVVNIAVVVVVPNKKISDSLVVKIGIECECFAEIDIGLFVEGLIVCLDVAEFEIGASQLDA